MRVVLDTNVLVSALLTPYGPAARVLDAVLAGRLVLVFDDRILREYKVKKVEIMKNKPEATVTYLDGKTEKMATERPAAVNFIRPNGNQGHMLDAITYFKLWGVPEEAMLFDPVRGGLVVRGAATHNNILDGPDRQTTTYMVFYTGEKQSWDGFFKRYPTTQKDINNADPMYVKNGTLYGDYGVGGAPWYLWGSTRGEAFFSGTGDNKTLTVIAE